VKASESVEAYETIVCEIAGPVATVTLNRPEARNAMSQRMVEELLDCFTTLAGDEGAGVRAVVLRATGDVFCAGGDVRDLADTTRAPEEQHAAIGKLDTLLRAVNEAPQVVIARVRGPVLGGGLGLVCVADIVIADTSARFGMPEVRLGLVPSLISPYVVARLGLARARYMMLTGQQFSAQDAFEFGLVHEIIPDADVHGVLHEILQCAPEALRVCKRLLFSVATANSPAATLDERVDLLNRLRAGTEARQGLLAFAAKQPAPWVPKP
jgi:enoyl-CoA hydratase/carnithine racemase